MGSKSLELGTGNLGNHHSLGTTIGQRWGSVKSADEQFASWIWFFSLRQLQELCEIWEKQPLTIQQAIQDQVSAWLLTDQGA
jgi:hypothetical protein